MKILRLEVFPLAIALRHPLQMAGRTISLSETIIVRLVTEARDAGWGEANVATLLTGETSSDIIAALALIEECLRGRDARDLRHLAEIMVEIVPAARSARAAVDMALHDSVARALGISVSRLLGGREALDAPTIALVDFSRPDWLEEGRQWMAEGARLIKLKVANAPVDEEIRLVRSAVAAFGDRAVLAADANGGWTLEQAQRFCAGLTGTPLLFLEQPLPPKLSNEAARLAGETGIAIGADEAIDGPEQIVRCAVDGFARGVSLKLLKSGGVTPLRDAAALARGLGLAVNLSGKVGESSIANAATLHAASAMVRPHWGVSLTAVYLDHDVVTEALPLTASAAVLRGPGLGIAVDERKLVDLASIPTPPRKQAQAA